MQLVNMEVARNAARAQTSLGPFSPGLNAVFGTRGSGKSALLGWLRTITAEDDHRNYADVRRESLPGSVEFASRGQRVRMRCDRDGRRQLENAGADWLSGSLNGPAYSRDTLHRLGGLSSDQRNAFAALLEAHGTADSEANLEAIATRLGLSTIARTTDDGRQHLLARQREVESRLRQLASHTNSRESLLTRRQELETELLRLQSGGQHLKYDGYPVEHRRYDDRFAVIEADLRDTLALIEEADRELAELQAELKILEASRSSVEVGDSYRVQLQQIDDRLTRWRQTLRDLKSHRDRIEYEATDARLDKEVGDQLSITKEPDPRAALRSLEAQILSARKQLDSLVDRYSVLHDHRDQDRNNFSVHQDAYGRTRIAYTDAIHYPDTNSLPETLRSMQKDLYEACQQLARHESRAASETLKQQSQQLQRCEAELLHSVEKLIEERAALLRKIADEYQLSAEQLSLSFGDWCDCQDHKHVHDWLLNESELKTPRVGTDPLARQRLLEAIDGVQRRRKTAALHVEDCRRQLRDAEFHRRGLVERQTEPHSRWLTDVECELGVVQSQLRDCEERDRLQAEADDLLRQLSAVRPQSTTDNRFRDLVNRNIVSLMGGRERLFSRGSSYSGAGFEDARRYDLVDGIVYDSTQRLESDVPAEIVRVAMRLAIAASLAARSEPIPVILDAALDQLSRDVMESAVAHLARVAAAGQQVIVMTANDLVTELVRRHHGWIGSLEASETSGAADVNRHLAALANDYEADKWYQPQVQPLRRSTPRGEYYLTERSRVEEAPSIDATSARACRDAGVGLIGDLLDADPYWLAEQIRRQSVTGATVAAWQAEARLLCAVRQLRPFDARLLVSIGVRTPQQLAEMHPSELLDRVEYFVSTDRGRQLLQSGSSYELSRITTWIASAKGGASRQQRSNFSHASFDRNGRSSSVHAGNGARRNAREYDRDELNADLRSDDSGYDGRSGYEPYSLELDERDFTTQYDRSSQARGRSTSRNAAARTPRSIRGEDETRDRQSRRDRVRSYPVVDGEDMPRVPREDRTRTRHVRSVGERANREPLKLASAGLTRDERLKFYLELASPVVDAPSIGPRMATRLEKLGILTVDQLLAANAESLADKLNLRRIDADVIRGWQEQARLVCRIPNLRGHDAQLLVACNLTSPEDLATMNPSQVLSQVSVVAESSDGQRILRGSKQPDLTEVTDWIAWAAQCRSLHAA